jgi:polygalacturonase
MSGDIFNVTFENLKMRNTGCGPRMKAERGRGGVIDGITYRNITAYNVQQMVQITLAYHGGIPAPPTPLSHQSSAISRLGTFAS